MDITYLGHSSFLIKGKSASLVTDPYDSSIGIKFPSVTADVVTVSHGHDDHNKSDQISGVKKVIQGPGEYEINGISIIGMSTYHDDQRGELRGKNTVYIIEIDEVRIAHLGDLGHELSEKQMEQMGEVNVLMIPVGGHYTIGPEGAEKIVKGLEANIVVPMHYQVQGLNPEIFKDLLKVDEFVSKSSLASETLPKLTVSQGGFGEESNIVVLEKK